MKCPYCNSELPDNSRFCDKCGQEISTENSGSLNSNNYWEDYQSKTSKADSEYQALVQKENDKLRSKRKMVIAAIVAIVLVVAMIVVVNIIRKNDMKSIISDAEALAANQNYQGAYELVSDGLKNYPKSEDMQEKADEYGEAWISATISEADLIAQSGDYESALDLVQTRLVTFPESDKLEQKVQDYTAELNKRICKTYSGTYSAGNTRGFDLEIISCDYKGHINAIFSFYGIDGSDMLFGSYKMEGDILNSFDDGSVEASLVGTEWIEQPGSFYMIDFNISINADQTLLTADDYEISGKVVDPVDYSPLVKTYSGTYKPGWGVTGLDLTILSCNSNGHIKAEFSFYKTSQNSSAKTGKFSMIGRIAETYSDGSVKIDLVGDEWIDSPGGMVMMIDFSIIINAQRDASYSDDYEINLAG